MKCGYVFVYGSLKVGGFFSRWFNHYRVSVQNARIKGKLYNLGAFPGAVLGGKDYIYGELHCYKSLSAVVKQLNHIEGYRGRGNESNLYNLICAEVEISNGGKVKALLYCLNTSNVDVNHYEVVENGVWPI